MLDRLPPRIIRRLILAPLVFTVSVALVAVSPVFLIVAFVVDLVLPGSWRTLRIVSAATAYLVLEVVAFIGLFGLWIGSGFGIALRTPRIQRGHFAFMRWWLHTLDRVIRKVFGLRIVIEERPVPRPGPILVFSRHAGPGNSLLLIGTILVAYGRRPRIVMLAKLQWEPLFDIFLNRTPNRFIRHDPTRRHLYIDAIGALASDMGPEDAFVLFPEGKDFTPRVRVRAIEYLRGRGHDRAAERAEAMVHVLPPRHNGVIAAMDHAPNADIVFVAHSVLEDIPSFRALWRTIPLDHPIHARYWRIPPDDVPRDQDARIEWLYRWWETIDAWIESHTAATGS